MTTASPHPASDLPAPGGTHDEPPHPVQIWPEAFAARYRAAGYWRDESFGAWLRERATAHPDRLAVGGGSQRCTYAARGRRPGALAARFLGAGRRAGGRL